MIANLVDAHGKSSQAAVEHKKDFGLVASRTGVLCILSVLDRALSSTGHTRVEKLLSSSNAIPDRLIAELDAVHGGGGSLYSFNWCIPVVLCDFDSIAT